MEHFSPSPLGLKRAMLTIALRDGACSHLATWRLSEHLGNLWIQVNQAPDNPMVPSPTAFPSSHKGDPIQPPDQPIWLWKPKEQNPSYCVAGLNLLLAELFNDGINL